MCVSVLVGLGVLCVQYGKYVVHTLLFGAGLRVRGTIGGGFPCDTFPKGVLFHAVLWAPYRVSKIISLTLSGVHDAGQPITLSVDSPSLVVIYWPYLRAPRVERWRLRVFGLSV